MKEIVVEKCPVKKTLYISTKVLWFFAVEYGSVWCRFAYTA